MVNPWGLAQSRAALRPLGDELCASLLRDHGAYRSVTRNFRNLRAILTSPHVSAEVRAMLDAREFQRAIWTLRSEGQVEFARNLQSYVEQSLALSGILSIKPVGTGLSGPQRVEFVGGIVAIFKPDVVHWSDENRDASGKWASLDAELLAYRFDSALGLGMVPVTVERTIGGVRGSLQIWVANGLPATNDIALGREKTIRLMRAFDYLINNRDRHEANFFFIDAFLVAIDHGNSFGSATLDMGAGPYPRIVFANPADWVDLAVRLRDALTDEVIDLLTADKIPAASVNLIMKRRGEMIHFQGSAIPPAPAPIPWEER